MLTKTKILTIGRDPELLGLIQEELNNGEYEVSSTQDVDAGLRDEVHEENPDFIILDIMMPSLDGIEKCLQIRQWTQVPIMMLSTWGTREGMVRGLDLCSESYLTDPFGIPELKSRINETLRRNASMANSIPNAQSGLF